MLVADDALTERQVYQCYLALCGGLPPTSELPARILSAGLRV
ncbi:MAG: hypothetical protein ACRDRU_07400 [Pseudonocardiaceae bacterium]